MRRRRPAWRRLCHVWWHVSALLLAVPAAAQEVAAPAPGSVADLPGWAEEDAAAALAPFLGTCRALAARDPAAPLGGAGTLAGRAGRAADWALTCAEAAALPPGAERAFLERRFAPVPLGTGLLTGYYEPVLSGRLAPDAAHPVPLRGSPPPPPEGARLPDRAAIEAGALDGLAPTLAYVDPVEAFFLQIQGSGRVVLPDGGLLRLLYAGKNGHPYRAIGRVLIERGEIPREAMSMQAIRAWLAAAPPDRAAALLRENPSYVFFRRDEALRPDEGPPGTLGVPLAPGRSLAVDPAQVPLGAPVWIVTRDPLDGRPIRQLVHAQDTGGAIRGPARGDLFWGWGEAAAERAGPMREPVEMTVLLPLPAP
ncbi:murein transglycosylase A [Paracraurococcus lichenis]|uniref:peptidoglycan lytic exotransglycosylase n=1 Tax=Paracraurococcus lichenis TaxID=3064888 RepID=A0ABT9DZ64_9PROT|nr:MltA domain-containing protein [Paracraurococcus sp. LOR1-02]MDO9709196.1 MltA domain-containing protein [Paracraurococcus sp. LOR1-02]